MTLMEIKNITLHQAMELYQTTKIGFIINDGKIKGMNKN